MSDVNPTPSFLELNSDSYENVPFGSRSLVASLRIALSPVRLTSVSCTKLSALVNTGPTDSPTGGSCAMSPRYIILQSN